MAELTVPQIDFSALGQLPTIYRQAQTDQRRQQTLANLGQGGQADSLALLRSGDLPLAQLGITMQNRAEDQARQASRDAVGDQHWNSTFGLQKSAEKRQQYEFDHTPDQYVPNPNAGQPGQPQLLDQYAQARAAAEANAGAGKPIPYETLGGTRFLMPKVGGGYDNVDPRTLGVQSSPRVVGDAEGVANGLYDAPKAPGQRPALQSDGQPQTAQQPADVTAVDPKTGRREGFLGSLDPQIQGYIKKIADYEIDPRTTSVKGGMREKLMSAVAQYDPSYNQNEFGARSKATKDFSTGPQGNIIRSFDVAIDHLDTLQKAATALKNGDTRIFNQIRNKWREETGSDLPTNFQALVPLVSGEIAKAVIGSNNALSDREELRANLKNANSPEQITGVIQGYKALMGGQLKGLKKQYEETTGKKDFDHRLRDVTKSELSGKSTAPVSIDGYTITEH